MRETSETREEKRERGGRASTRAAPGAASVDPHAAYLCCRVSHCGCGRDGRAIAALIVFRPPCVYTQCDCDVVARMVVCMVHITIRFEV